MEYDRSLARIPGYAEAREIAEFVQGIEGLFPDDQIATLYRSLGSAAIGLGARIAGGYGKDGLDGQGRLSERTRRRARGELYRLRHYVSICAERFYLDENRTKTIEALCAKVERALEEPAGRRTATARGGSDE